MALAYYINERFPGDIAPVVDAGDEAVEFDEVSGAVEIAFPAPGKVRVSWRDHLDADDGWFSGRCVAQSGRTSTSVSGRLIRPNALYLETTWDGYGEGDRACSGGTSVGVFRNLIVGDFAERTR